MPNHVKSFSSIGPFLLLLTALTLLPSVALAQSAPMDFSDAQQQVVQWPFNVIDYWIEDDGMNVFQHSRVSESSSSIYEMMREAKNERSVVNGFHIMGATKNAQPGHYTLSLAIRNVRYFVTVKPDGTGAELVLKSTPNAIVSGYFKRALYPYRLGEGMEVGTNRFNFADE